MQQHEYQFYVYILASRSRTLYIGFTNNIRVASNSIAKNAPALTPRNTISIVSFTMKNLPTF